MIMFVGITFVMMTMSKRPFVFSPAPGLFFITATAICRRLLIHYEAGHETAREQVSLQLSGIRVDPLPVFARSARTSYLVHVVPNHVGHRVSLVSNHPAFAHMDDHGRLRVNIDQIKDATHKHTTRMHTHAYMIAGKFRHDLF
jgi:hypothetical protein